MTACVISSPEPCKDPLWRGMLCSRHYGNLLTFLRDIPRHARTVRAMTGHATTPQTERTSGSKDQPLPAGPWLGIVGPATDGRVACDPECDVDPPLLFTVTSWAAMVEAERRLTPQTYPPSLLGLTRACQTLVVSLDWICEQPWVDECWAELDLARRAVRAAAGDNPQPQRGKVPCPACGMRTLWQEDANESYRCVRRLKGCGLVLCEADYGRLADTLGSSYIKRDAEQAEPDPMPTAARHWRGEGPRHTPPADEAERSIRAYGPDVRDEDFLRSEWVRAQKKRDEKIREKA